jgi:ComF family protein
MVVFIVLITKSYVKYYVYELFILTIFDANATIASMLKETLSALTDILFPRTCHICSQDIKDPRKAFDASICRACAADMIPTSLSVCSLCGSDLSQERPGELTCRGCRKKPPAYQKLLACYRYNGTAKALIHKFKYQNRPYLAKTMARLIFMNLTRDNNEIARDIDILIPVPLTPAKTREREFNQSELLAKELSMFFKKPWSPVLKKIRHTHPQASLTNLRRLDNLRDAFRAFPPSAVNNKKCLLIDDVVTTAATAREASRALKRSGAAYISVLAFSKG